jgi:N utilization substance protein A
VRQVVNELRGEKVDVVQWRDDTGQFIAEALGPAKVKEVHIDEATKTADVVVSEHQLSLAIGKEGQNARLAARLSGYKVDIRSDTEGAEEEAASADGEATAVVEEPVAIDAEAAPEAEPVVEEPVAETPAVEEPAPVTSDAEADGDDEDAVAEVSDDEESE